MRPNFELLVRSVCPFSTSPVRTERILPFGSTIHDGEQVVLRLNTDTHLDAPFLVVRLTDRACRRTARILSYMSVMVWTNFSTAA